jgi:hypothetical protein
MAKLATLSPKRGNEAMFVFSFAKKQAAAYVPADGIPTDLHVKTRSQLAITHRHMDGSQRS